MTLFFNLNVNNAFDNVSHLRLLYNIRRKNFKQTAKINKKLFKKNITLIVKDHIMTKRKISVNISQNLLFFSILYLFYNANLLKLCKNIKLRFNVIKFVNKINILMYSESTKRNYEMLKKI